MTDITVEDLIAKHGVDKVRKMLAKITGKPMSKAKSDGHSCPGCRSTDIYYLERPLRWGDVALSGVGCNKCGCKWSRYDMKK